MYSCSIYDENIKSISIHVEKTRKISLIISTQTNKNLIIEKRKLKRDSIQCHLAINIIIISYHTIHYYITSYALFFCF